MFGVGALDLVYAALVPFGVEDGTLKHILAPWSHSLVMAMLWSALLAALFWRSGRTVVLAMAAAAFSHWPLDVLSHYPDMEWGPYAQPEFGFGQYLGSFGGWCELTVSAFGIVIYVRWARRPENAPRLWPAVAAVVAIMCGLEIAVAR